MQGIDALKGLRYELRMMGILISKFSYIYGENMSVLHNKPRPESFLRKKSNLVCCHVVSESFAMRKSLIGHIPSKENVTDLMTQVFMGKREGICLAIFFMIFKTTISYQFQSVQTSIRQA